MIRWLSDGRQIVALGQITQDGETIDGDKLEKIIVQGKVTTTILDGDDKFRLTI